MQPVQLAQDIFWVGAVDFNLRNFHHYSRSPHGSTYNAYLVKDEKTVLFDTVSAGYYDELVKHIENLVPAEKIDYIVCNHLEKDHAGALPRLVELCKPEKIFCSVMGEKSIKGQFDTTGWPLHVVKDGERISIGKRHVTFLETRMLHWPDSMVSYIEEDHLLISNDAFGQNVATSHRFADEYDKSLLLEAMKDYYYNIVLPYSPFVLKTLKRIADLGIQIDCIAPDHGLIFRTPKDVQFVLDTYRELAEQKPKLKAIIAYETMWNATEKMAYAIGDGLNDAGVPYELINMQQNHCSVVAHALADSGAIILGSATRNNLPLVNMMALLANLKGLRPQNLLGAAFGSYGWSGEAPKIMSDELAAMKVEIAADPLKVYFEPKDNDYTACRAMGKQIGEALKAKING